MIFIEALVLIIVIVASFLFGAYSMLGVLNDIKDDADIIKYVRETRKSKNS